MGECIVATWKSKRTANYSEHMGDDYAKCEKSWEYGTVSDSLRVITKRGAYSVWGKTEPESESSEYYSQEEALALLETLVDWAETYEGEGTVADIIKYVKESNTQK